MSFVLDASAAMILLFQEENPAAAGRLMTLLASESAIAPQVWHFEVANALRVAEMRQRATPAETAKSIAMLHHLPLEIESEAPAIALLLALAREYGLSAYDAAYLELALRKSCGIATFDKKLAAASVRAGLSLIH